MKKLVKIAVLIAGIAIISASSLFAQKSGVFKTFGDFTSGKMEYSIDCATEKHKIRLNEFLGKDFITVVHEGKPYNLKKDEIWGYQLCDDKIVRFQDNEHYPVADKGILWIYTKQTVKGAGYRGGTKTITTHYFSKGGDNGILELTPLNLKASFPDNHMLHDAIDAQFKSATSLSEYDKFHKQYKINHFLESQGIK
ncbi:MAG: hypothetical protein PHP53_19000 [Prolixibacteraceae bacterium]|jgi:hypothetical protein|nr:hypothetical protein [Prolixibacteraceae bacterium]